MEVVSIYIFFFLSSCNSNNILYIPVYPTRNKFDLFECDEHLCLFLHNTIWQKQ